MAVLRTPALESVWRVDLATDGADRRVSVCRFPRHWLGELSLRAPSRQT